MIKKQFILLALAVVALLSSSCGSVTTISGGHSDEAYIIVTSPMRYDKNAELYVQIDDLKPVLVDAVRPNKASSKGARLVVLPGRHKVVVFDKDGKVLYDKQIFPSTGKVKKINVAR